MVVALMYPAWLSPAASNPLARCLWWEPDLAQRKAFAVDRNVEPAHAFFVLEREGHLGLLFRAERGQQAIGGFGHHRNSVGVVMHTARGAGSMVLRVALLAGNQTASQKRPGRTQKRTPLNVAHEFLSPMAGQHGRCSLSLMLTVKQ